MCASRTETASTYCVWKGCTKFECIPRSCPVSASACVRERCVRFDDNDDYYDAHQQHHIPKTEIQKGNFLRCVFGSGSKTEYDVCALGTRCRPEEEREWESGGEPARGRENKGTSNGKTVGVCKYNRFLFIFLSFRAEYPSTSSTFVRRRYKPSNIRTKNFLSFRAWTKCTLIVRIHKHSYIE